MTTKHLTLTETRVLGTLMEKARTVPDSYPLSLNALLSGCNQKTSREPLMDLSESEVQAALDALKSVSLVFEGSASRVPRYEHNFQRGYGVSEPQAVLLGLLMLRGAQTAGELRINSERWYKFADIAAIEAVLDELQDLDAQRGRSFVQRLPRAPGAREQRWAHLLCGPIDESKMALAGANSAQATMKIIANDTLEALLQRVQTLEDRVQRLETELGLSQD